ncbi:MAG: hypothetical protein ABMA64_05900 [Myxococcota bacterium]
MWLLLPSLASAGTQCAATDGSGIRFRESQPTGGAPPRPDTVVHSLGWYVGDTPIHEVSRTADVPPPLPEGRLDWRWDPASTQVLSSSRTEWSSHTVYTATVRLFTRDGSPLGGGLTESSRSVVLRCERDEAWGMP